MTVIYNMSIDRADKPWIGDRRLTESSDPCSDLFLMDREPYVLPHVCPQKPYSFAAMLDASSDCKV